MPVLVTSSATRLGLDELARELLRRVPPAEPVDGARPPGEDEVAEYRVFRPAARRAFDVERVGAGEFRVTGDAVDRLIARHDLENEEALAHVEHRLRRMGVIAALEARGLRARRRRRDRRRSSSSSTPEWPGSDVPGASLARLRHARIRFAASSAATL